MGTCVICGASVEGAVCSLHEEDVAFEFRGDDPGQLTTHRYYRGEVDGFADFGVFVELGGGVTGLLHKSELDRRLDSLDWTPGQEVYVQVIGVHDNGNVDLGWSIRQSADEFRDRLIDDPAGDAEYEDEDEPVPESGPTSDDSASGGPSTGEGTGADASTGEDAGTSTGEDAGAETSTTDGGDDAGATPRATAQPNGGGSAASGSAGSDRAGEARRPTERVAVDSLADRVGDVVRLEGEITDAHQTPGPTIFEVTDESGAVECAAFEEAGVRAYPEVDAGDVVRLTGEVERRRGSLQVETAALKLLTDDEREAVERRLSDALDERARPPATEPLADDPAVAAVEDDLVAAATAIRRAVIRERPVVVRHPATVDGYVAGAAIERAVLPLVREHHAASDAVYHYVDRRPMEDGFYEMDDATGDVTGMLEAVDRHDEKLPLFVFAGAGSTRESLDAFRLLDVYGADRVVVDGGVADEAVADAVTAIVNPALRDADGTRVTATVLAATLAASVNPDVREDLRHLPAVSYWTEPPASYRELAERAGHDADDVRETREAIALEAFYQSYEDKRELVEDLLWGDGTGSLAAHVSGQFRTKLDEEVETALPHVEQRDVGGVRFAVLDVEAYTHRYDFPTADVLLAALHSRLDDGADDPRVTLGVDEDDLRLRSTTPVDVRAVAAAVDEAVPDAGVTPRGAVDGRIEFLVGERERVLEATVDAIADLL